MALPSQINVDCPHCKGGLKVKIPGGTEPPVAGEVVAPAAPAAPASPLDLGEIARRLSGVEKGLQAVPADFCTRFPELCNGVAEINARLQQKDEEDAHTLFSPTDELFEHWDSCPDCKGKADEYARRLVARVKASEQPNEPASAPKPEAKKETPLPPADDQEPEAEYIPPWKR